MTAKRLNLRMPLLVYIIKKFLMKYKIKYLKIFQLIIIFLANLLIKILWKYLFSKPL